MPHLDRPPRIHYRMAGRAGDALLVLSNSLGTDMSMWRGQMDALVGRHRVLRYDTRGHGRSAATDDPVTIPDLGEDVLALAEVVGAERFSFCGISMGGLIGLWLAIHHPDRLRAVVVCNTAAKIGTAELWDTRIRAVRDGGMAAILGPVVARVFTDCFPEERPELFAEFAAMLGATPAAGYIRSCEAIRDTDLRADVGRIAVPLLVVAGAEDVATPPEQAGWLHDRVPGSELAVIEGAAHLSNVERPTEFNAVVAEFLERG